MRRSRFTDEQIISILRDQEAGVSTAEISREHGISNAKFFKWQGYLFFGSLA